MKNLSLSLFEVALLIFAYSVVMTMYLMSTDIETERIMGLNYGFYMLPLIVVNLLICIRYSKYLYFKGLSKWIIIWGIIVSLNVILLSSHKSVYIIRVNLWVTTYLASYCLVRKERSSIDGIVRSFLIIYVFSFFYFWITKFYKAQELMLGLESGSNVIFCLVTILPFCLLLKNKLLSLILIILTFISSVFSNKRSVSLILLLLLIPSLRNVISGDIKTKKRTFWVYVILIILVLLLLYVSQKYMNNSLFVRFANIESDGGSGRIDIWSQVLNDYSNSSLTKQIFGHGHYAVSSLLYGLPAHNDFLEVLYDYGILGLIPYLIIHISLLMRLFKLKRTKNYYFYSYAAMYVIFLIMSMVSILIVQQRYLVYFAIYWGCLEGSNYKVEYRNK